MTNPINPELVPIRHEGVKPEWLRGDENVFYNGPAGQGGYHTAERWSWAVLGDYYFLPADHMFAPVLRLGGRWTPWNAPLQGDGPPKNYAGGKVMFRDGEIKLERQVAVEFPLRWTHRGVDHDIIGYEASEPDAPMLADDSGLPSDDAQTEGEIARLQLDVAAQEALYDSAYKAGLKAGWNFCASDDEAGFASASASTEHVEELKRIRAARKALSEQGAGR